MRKIDLKQFEPKPHPYKRVFQEHRVRQVVVARYLGIDSTTLNVWLNGYKRIPLAYQGKLEALVNSLEESE